MKAATKSDPTSATGHGPEALVRPFGDVWPRIDVSAWLAPNAVVVGDVEIGANSSIWYGTTLRGDVNGIRIGAGTNVQDHCVFHVSAAYPCRVGDGVSVGHRAVVHGCTVADGALIGIGAIVLDGAEIGAEALVGAGALVSPGTVVPEGMLALGIPARVTRPLTSEERARQRERAEGYIQTARLHARVEEA
jgi:carbonic anhydrase/acetyltransferase-like protein (isoleucine patch superfamily)